jgi:Ca2+-binding EF-hand superfamily protein
VDENGDGEISFEEFVTMMKKIGEWSDENNKSSKVKRTLTGGSLFLAGKKSGWW